MNPSVSVIVPTYNRVRLLEQALVSVLDQTYAPREILIVDDGSTDDTRAAVAALGTRVHYFYQSNRGPAAARNLGIQNAHGELIAFLDADDVWVPEAIEWRIARLQDGNVPPAQIVMGLTQRVTPGEGDELVVLGAPWAANLFGSALCAREVFVRVGLLDETLKYGEDVDWFLRVREQNIPVAFLDRVTLWYRIHADSLMYDTRQAKLYMLQALKKSLARRTDAATGIVTPLTEMPDLQERLKMIQGTKP